MRLRDLMIDSNNNGGGIYHQIYSHRDYHEFLKLCSIHKKARMYSLDTSSQFSPTKGNISKYLKTKRYAYISDVSGVVGVFDEALLGLLEGYEKMTLSNKLVLHNAIKHYKG